MKRLFLTLALLASALIASAQLRLGSPFQEGMVLQQESKAEIWGEAKAGAKVTITPSWGKGATTTANEQGKWRTHITTPKGSFKTYNLTVSSGNQRVRIDDVLIGEVWLASGQSNMEMPLRGFYNCPTEGANAVMAQPASDAVRMYNVERKRTYEPQEYCNGEWLKDSPQERKEMSATAFFFARQLSQSLQLPIGILNCSYGGTRVESWLPREILENYPDEDLTPEGIAAMPWDYKHPMEMYNAMLYPIVGYTIKGIIWYQGCSNVYAPENYTERLTTMVAHWRELWGDENNNLPFYEVEIAPYRYKDPSENCKSALLRRAQHEATKQIPNSAIVVTNDLVYSYESDNIHPAKKQEVGQRLAWLALHRDYGFGHLACYSPTAVKVTRRDGKSNELSVFFDNMPNGVNRWREIEGLEVAGSEGIFYPVTFAYYEWNPQALTIRSEFVHDPMVVRYGWGDFKPGNLKSLEGLPVAPFEMWVSE